MIRLFAAWRLVRIANEWEPPNPVRRVTFIDKDGANVILTFGGAVHIFVLGHRWIPADELRCRLDQAAAMVLDEGGKMIVSRSFRAQIAERN